MNHQEKAVQNALRLVDPELFLDKLYDQEGQYVYYAVRYPCPGTDPLTCVHWRTMDGPLPLSLDIVDVVRRNEGDIRESIREVTINNALKKERDKADRDAAYQEELDWYIKSNKRLGIYGPWSNASNVD